jgi:hypothetical protein
MGKLSLALRSFSDVTNEPAREVARKKAVAEAISAAKGPTVTTDLEVSPLLAGTAAKGFEKTPAPPTVKFSQPASNSKLQIDSVRIYRGGAPSTVKAR